MPVPTSRCSVTSRSHASTMGHSPPCSAPSEPEPHNIATRSSAVTAYGDAVAVIHCTSGQSLVLHLESEKGPGPSPATDERCRSCSVSRQRQQPTQLQLFNCASATGSFDRSSEVRVDFTSDSFPSYRGHQVTPFPRPASDGSPPHSPPLARTDQKKDKFSWVAQKLGDPVV